MNPVSQTQLELPSWPGGAPAAVSLTFDVDAESAVVGDALDAGRRADEQLGRLSARTFGIVRGVGRILDVLDRFDVRGTFYVPGLTVEAHPEAVLAIADRGHELGHHGYAHRRMDRLDAAGRNEELVRGLAAHERCVGRPKGYRAPAWELPPEALPELAALGFAWDSSLMGDDRPYRASLEHTELLELPVHWTLDDWPYLGFDGERGNVADPRVPLRVWLDEFDAAARESRHVTYTMHPEVIGRGHCIRLLAELLTALRQRGAAFLTHGELAALLQGR